MGTKLAPAYANIFMGKLEHTILSSAILKPLYYRRYIDDVLILWPHSITKLNKFITSLNNYHPSIKFTSEVNPNKITFLDVNIYKGPNFEKLDVETYIKPTNRQAYIYANSYHPRHRLKSSLIKHALTHIIHTPHFFLHTAFCSFSHTEFSAA